MDKRNKKEHEMIEKKTNETVNEGVKNKSNTEWKRREENLELGMKGKRTK